MLRIKRLTIKNFRQYRNVDLKFDDSQGLFLFIGKNGMGKSNLLNAICWCLYEELPFKVVDNKDHSLLNEEAASEKKYDDVRVTLEVEMDGRTYSFERSWRETQSTHLGVMVLKGQNWIEEPNPTVVVNNFLPNSIRKFFLFEGERVQDLFKGDYAKNLRESILKVSDVELLDRALDHLEKVGRDVRRQVSQNEPKLEKEESDLSNLEDLIKEKKGERVRLEHDRKQLSENIKKLKVKQSEFSRYRDLYDKRKQLEEQHDLAVERRDGLQDEIEQLIIELAPFFYIRESLADVGKKINEDKTKGEIPPKIRAAFIEELIELGECICGTKLLEGKKELAKLQTLLKRVELVDKKSFLLEDSFEIKSILSALDLLPKKLRDLREKRAKIDQEIEKTEKGLKEVRESLKKAPDEEIGNLEKTIQRMEDEQSNCDKQWGAASSDIDRFTKQQSEISDKILKSAKKNEEQRRQQAQYEFLETARAKVAEIRNILVDRVRRVVSMSTDKYFKQLIWKKDEYDKAEFTEDYEVRLRKVKKASDAFQELSTGEMKVFAYATIKALTEISGFEGVPIFIDGPLENLDVEVRANLLELLKVFMPEKQVFILSVDHDDIKQFGEKNVKKENFYRLTRDEDGSTSTAIKNFYDKR